MTKKSIYALFAIIMGFSLTSTMTYGAGPFEGKTIRIIVGVPAGGGFDAYARTIARHMSKYIPGKPTIIVENMPGAGSMIAANYLFNVAKPDGLTIGHFDGGLFTLQVMGRPGPQFDAKEFEFIGAPMAEGTVCLLTKASGITSVNKWLDSKTPLKMGGTMPGAYAPGNVLRIIRAALGLPIKLVEGYKGNAPVRLAIMSGELDGTAYGWVAVRSIWHEALAKGDIIPVLQLVPKPFPDLPNVPLAIDLAKTDSARQLIEIGIHKPRILVRPFVLPPGTPKEIVGILRKAFQETLKDKELLAEIKKANLYLDPVSGEELEKAVSDMFKIDPATLAKLKKILFD
jgi:tripartite-type tricarboxylate transporter receptor subunit TctC